VKLIVVIKEIVKLTNSIVNHRGNKRNCEINIVKLTNSIVNHRGNKRNCEINRRWQCDVPTLTKCKPTTTSCGLLQVKGMHSLNGQMAQ
jgi:hypothetical protein